MNRTTKQIERFRLQVDDMSELSSDEELILANEVYQEIQSDRDWEWLKKTYTGILSTSVNYIDLPDDFKYVAPDNEGYSYVYIGDNYTKYIVVSFSDKFKYRNTDGYCYIDTTNNRLVFLLQQTEAKSVFFDYISEAPILDENTNPLFKERFDHIIGYGMSAQFNPIEQSDKSSSYQKENRQKFEDILSDMAIEDAKIKLSI